MKDLFTTEENIRINESIKYLLHEAKSVFLPGDINKLKSIITTAFKAGQIGADVFGFNKLLLALLTAKELTEQFGADRTLIISILLDSIDNINPNEWGKDITSTYERLQRVRNLYNRGTSVGSENFKKLLLTLAEDIRVIILMITARLVLMREINRHPDEEKVKKIAIESRFLYAPLAHRLGLYVMKGHLEDLSLKYTDRETYTAIARKLNETKSVRDAYIANFITPVKKRLQEAGLHFDIKGRTKSIYSIWNKIRKQRTDIDHIYDLFAIRIIIDTPPEKEKQACWLAYSIITDMYRPNPARMKDWISIPKANGYESLHTTVYGPDDRWVEVQIRTRRMDEIAEKGLAAHWKYKGGQAEKGLDSWMGKVRDILESAESGPMELMKNYRMDVYSKEVFVFTPKGDLYNLPEGATLLDFAFHIHTNVGARCTGGRVNGRVRKINYRLNSGDTVEIMTSPSQQPKQDWLNFAITSRARNKIRLALKERESQTANIGKELLSRRLKNRKIEISEAEMMKVIKHLGYKNVTEFYSALGNENLDINSVTEAYDKLFFSPLEAPTTSADEFVLNTKDADNPNNQKEDILVIGEGQGVGGMRLAMARCCKPIYGDNVFGFVSATGVIKIHRADCPNARDIKEKYPYRIIKTRWSGKYAGQMSATLSIVGNDDIGVVTNITSLISKESGASLRNISVDSFDGLFQGLLVIGIDDTKSLNNLIKKIKTIKGVKDVKRNL